MSQSPTASALKGVWAGVLVLLLLSAFPAFGATVTNTLDSGPGSLRDTIASAPSGDTIDFSLPPGSTITLGTPITFPRDLTISGPGADSLFISGGDSVVVFIINTGTTATISGLTIRNGSSLLGGGVFNAGTLTLADCAVSENFQGTQLGGGIFNAGDLTVSNCDIVENSAGPRGLGGGIYNFSGMLTLANHTRVFTNDAQSGGGLYINAGTVTLIDSIVFHNSSVGDCAGLFNGGELTVTGGYISNNFGGLRGGTGNGGGICNDFTMTVTSSTISENGEVVLGGGVYNRGAMTLTNSTVAVNSAVMGSGIYVDTPDNPDVPTASLDVSNSTIASNWGSQSGGGITVVAGTALGVKNSIVASNVNGNCAGSGTSGGHNLSDDATCAGIFTGAGDLNSTPAGLVGLQDNGGPTETMALLATSAAVDAIPLSDCTDLSGNPVTTDQRGVPRPQGPACDIGAFEFFQSSFQVQAVQTFLIIDSVGSLSLPAGTQQGLIAPLQAAVASLNRGDVTPAINQLGAFVNHTNALVHSGTLTAPQASRLITPAQTLIQDLSSMGG